MNVEDHINKSMIIGYKVDQETTFVQEANHEEILHPTSYNSLRKQNLCSTYILEVRP